MTMKIQVVSIVSWCVLAGGCGYQSEPLPADEPVRVPDLPRIQSAVSGERVATILREIDPSLSLSPWQKHNATHWLEVQLATADRVVTNDCQFHIEIAIDKNPGDLANYVTLLFWSDRFAGQQIPREFPEAYRIYILGFLSRAFPDVEASRIVGLLNGALAEQREGHKRANMTPSFAWGDVTLPPYRFDISQKDNVAPWGRGEWELTIYHEQFDRRLNPQNYR